MLHILFFLFLIMTPTIFIHEFGHFSVARFFGVGVSKFAIGMGPKLFGYKDRKGTIWQFCLLPIGGYIQPIQKPEEGVVGKPLNTLNRGQKILVYAAGPLINILQAIMLIAAVAMTTGISHVSTTIDKIDTHGASFNILQAGDTILTINGKPLHYGENLNKIANPETTEHIHVTFLRNGQTLNADITPRTQTITYENHQTEQRKMMGIVFKEGQKEQISPLKAIEVAPILTCDIISENLRHLWMMATGKESPKHLHGIIGISQMQESLPEKANIQLMLMANIAIGIAVINLIPISTVLDGGKIVLTTFEAIIRRSIPKRIEYVINFLSLCVITSLFFFTTLQDSLNILTNPNVAEHIHLFLKSLH